MRNLKEFDIPFRGLKEGKHNFDYRIDNTFFEHFEYDEYNDSNLLLELIFNKKSTLLELHFNVTGSINVNCDVTDEPYNQEISATYD